MLSRTWLLARRFARYTRIEQKDLTRMAKKGISQEDLVKFTAERYNPKAAVKEAVEQLYFADLEKAELKDFVKKLGKDGDKVNAIGGSCSVTLEYQLTEEEDQKLSDLFSRRTKTEMTTEELNRAIKETYYTKRLLRVFLSNMKSVNKASLLLFFDSLERNLSNIEEAERQEKALWQRKRDSLRKMNPKLDIKYRVDHYDRAKVLSDDCYKRIKAFILTRISGEEATLNNVADLCCKMLDFEKKLDDEFMEVLTKALDRVSAETVDAEYLGSVLSKSLLVMSRLKKHKITTMRVACFDQVPKAESPESRWAD